MATRSLGTLTLDLIAKVGGFVDGMDKAERKSKDSTKKIAGYAKNVSIAFAATGAAAAAGLVALVNASINAADELSKTSKIVGVAIDDLSGLKHAAELSGVEFAQLESGLIKLNRSTADAFEGVGAGADAYDALNISVKNADGTLKNNYDLIEEIADRFQEMEDGAKKAALAQDLFGRSGAKLIPLLNGGAEGLAEFRKEAERLGLVIDQETGDAAEQFNDNIDRLKKSLVGLGYTIAAEVAPDLAEFTDIFADPAFQSSIADIASGIVSIGTSAVTAVKDLTTFGKVLGEEIARIRNGIDTSNLTDVQDQIEKVKSAIENPTERLRFFGKNGLVEYFNEDELKVELEKLLNQRDNLIKNNPPPSLIANTEEKTQSKKQSFDDSSIEKQINADIDDRIKLQNELNAAYENQEAAYRETLALSDEIGELDRIRYAIASGALVGINEQQQMRLEGLAAEIDAINAAKKAEEERAALTKEYEAVRQGIISQDKQLIEQAEERGEVLKKALEEGIIAEQEYGELVILNSEKLKDELEQIKEKTNELDEFTKNAARSIQSELSDAIVNGFEGGSDDLLKRWGKLLQRLVADAIAADLTRALFGQSNSGGQMGTGQILSGLAGLFGGFFDGGGSIGYGQFGIVGEKGPEIVRGPAVVTGRMETEKMLGGNSIGNINMNFPGVTNSQEARRAAGAAGRELLSVIQGAQRYS
jgi:hypothetical protein